MRKSIFDSSAVRSPAIRIDSFFAELAIVIPVFAVSCCGVLKMLAVSAERAYSEEIRASSVSCVQSLCEIYSVCGNIDTTVVEMFNENAAQCCSEGISYVIPVDGKLDYNENNPDYTVRLSETVEDARRDNIVYGQLRTLRITLEYSDSSGGFSEEAVFYEPLAAVINMGTEGVQ